MVNKDVYIYWAVSFHEQLDLNLTDTTYSAINLWHSSPLL